MVLQQAQIADFESDMLSHHFANLPKSDIGNAVAKVLQGYDWSLVPLANR